MSSSLQQNLVSFQEAVSQLPEVCPPDTPALVGKLLV